MVTKWRNQNENSTPKIEGSLTDIELLIPVGREHITPEREAIF